MKQVVLSHIDGESWHVLAKRLNTAAVLKVPDHRLFIQDSRLLLKMIRLGLRPTMLLPTSDRWLDHLGYKGYGELP